MINDFKILKISRLANGVAHENAKFILGTRSNGILVNTFSSCVVYAVVNDFLANYNE